jgi:hypothetical protein
MLSNRLREQGLDRSKAILNKNHPYTVTLTIGVDQHGRQGMCVRLACSQIAVQLVPGATWFFGIKNPTPLSQ